MNKQKRKDLKILLRTLGLNRPITGDHNELACEPCSPDFLGVMRLCASGMMEKSLTSEWMLGEDNCYQVTKLGKEYALAHESKVKRLTKGQRAYRKFLKASVDSPNLTFGEFLTEVHSD